ncbi:MAG: hypothetical protein JWO85_2659 [Candidatus Eremiobacteraeota bacterium]|nr:hypothetical protein [Candidatus Eremiobacteraeota bacterium]
MAGINWGAAPQQPAPQKPAKGGAIDWGNVAPAHAPTSGRSINDVVRHETGADGGAHTMTAGEWEQTSPNPFARAGRTVNAALGKVLDAQRWGVAKLATGESDPEKQVEAQFKAIGVSPEHRASESGFERGLGSLAMQTVTDPVTIETLGLAAVPKVASKLAGPALNALNATPVGRLLHDFMQWGGPVARERGAETVQHIRGAANFGSSTGDRVQQHLVQRFKHVVEGVHPKTGKPVAGAGLSDEEKMTVARALNGEVAHEMPGTLTPREQSAYRQLRTLTELDFKLREDAARKVVFNDLTRELSAEDKATLTRAFASKKEPAIPQPTQRVRTPTTGPSAQQRSRQINEAQPLQGPGITMREQRSAQLANTPLLSGPNGYTMPHGNAAAIEHATKLRDLYHTIAGRVEEAMPRREDYMPWSHEAAAEEAGGREAIPYNMLERRDPRAIERPNLEVTNPSQLSRGFNAMAKNTGRQVERGIVHEALGTLVDDPEVHKLFDQVIKATGNKRTDIQKAKDAWLSMVSYPRAATVAMLPRHGVNILDLLANTVGPTEAPRVLKETMALARKLVLAKTEKEAAALTAEGRQLGALSGQYAERKPFFQEFSTAKVPERVPFTDTPMPKAVAGKSVLGPLAGKPTSVKIGGRDLGLGPWTRWNNKLVWAVDEAAKQTYAKLIVERGEAEGLQAGGLASSRLVDYAHHSPLVKALRGVAPFGTFRGSIPGAVIGGVARNPARAAFLNRATGGTMYGDKPEPGSPGITLYNPTADIGRALGSPQEYLRGTLGAPAQGAATLGLEAVTAGKPGASLETIGQEIQDAPQALAHGQLPGPRKASKYADAVKLRTARYLNYGNPIDLKWLLSAAASGVLEARDALTEMGYGQFKPRQGNAAQRGVSAAAQQALGVGIRW